MALYITPNVQHLKMRPTCVYGLFYNLTIHLSFQWNLHGKVPRYVGSFCESFIAGGILIALVNLNDYDESLYLLDDCNICIFCEMVSFLLWEVWCRCSILCLIPRTTVTSLSVPKDTRCKTHPLRVNSGVPFWTCEKSHKLRARWQACRSWDDTNYSPHRG